MAIDVLYRHALPSKSSRPSSSLDVTVNPITLRSPLESDRLTWSLLSKSANFVESENTSKFYLPMHHPQEIRSRRSLPVTKTLAWVSRVRRTHQPRILAPKHLLSPKLNGIYLFRAPISPG